MDGAKDANNRSRADVFATGGNMSVDPKTLAVYNEKAADYAATLDHGGKAGAHLVRFIAAIPAGGRVLDLGCGPGGSAHLMMQAGLDVNAVDASPEMVRFAQSKGVAARIATFDDLDAAGVYDGVWANFSLLHAPREKLSMHFGAIAQALRVGGHLHVGMKTGKGNRRDRLERLYTFVEEVELTNLLRDAGFDVVTTRTGSDIGLAGTNDPWVIMLARKN
ncbi:methyltransferase domain-containing protein [Octadecabacter antarcticus]|uniref:methyltransferase domain-containing protein n=1 Tax=Octadecabacter antarcticus TaxID=1217908 RepID=UPI002FDEC809